MHVLKKDGQAGAFYLGHALLEGFAFDEIGDEIELAVFVEAYGADAHDAGMADARGGFEFELGRGDHSLAAADVVEVGESESF